MVGEKSIDFDRLAAELGGRRDHPLGDMTTYRVGGAAAVFVNVESRADLDRVASVLSSADVPVLVIGRGSNLLVSDRGFAGIVVQLGDFAAECEIHPETHSDGTTAVVTVGGSAALPVVARRTAAAGWTGFEWAVGVPGSVGGAVRMNAGGHGSDMATNLVEVELVNMRTGFHGWRSADGLGLRFRGSDLTDHDVVVSARLALLRGDPDVSRRNLDEIVKWRREHQPGGQNAGSVFVNPIPGELSAGELIDRAGLRGLRIGSAEVSTKHANFIQADDGGRADDVRALIDHVREEVQRCFDIVLRSEIRLVGFDDVGPTVQAG